MDSCPACGAKNRSFYRYCPVCGFGRTDHAVAREGGKSAGMAVFLSTVIPGLGQFYNGEKILGSVLMVLSVLLMTAVVYFAAHPFLVMGQVFEGSASVVRLDVFMVILLLAAFFILAGYAVRRGCAAARGDEPSRGEPSAPSVESEEQTYPLWAWVLIVVILLALVSANTLLLIGILS